MKSKAAFRFVMVLALAVFIFLLLVAVTVWMSAPTKGKRIADYANPRTALLVIDVQEDFTGVTAKSPFPYQNAGPVIETVNTVLGAAQKKGVIPVYIRQELDGFLGRLLSRLFAGGTVIRGNPGTEIDRRVLILSGHVFSKPRSDAFSNPEFEAFLLRNQVGELILVGLDADGCVHGTARGALNRGYGVSIVADALLLREESKWDALLNRYREEGIRLITSGEFCGT